jgi:aminopeptidase
LVNRDYFVPVHLEQRVAHTKWVVLRWPSPAMAQQADMSTEAFEDYFFRVCNLDYAKLSRAMDPLVTWLEKTDRVRIVAPGTDLHFSIKGIPVVKCDGRLNIPDGEVYTAPVRDSIEGVIRYNAPTIYQGATFSEVQLTFEQGRIVSARAGDESSTKKLNEILDSDEGARYVGEFALGLNPHITRPIRDILFDEKIMGSIHLTPGQAYETADNGNRSQIHWDLVLIQTEARGGGELYFDDELVRRNGIFMQHDMVGLNPDHLLDD